MNPELQRNLWLEFTWSRVALMAGVLGLIFTLGWYSNSPGDDDNRIEVLASIAEGLFIILAVVWGSFKAGRSVSDEIRERTWDTQRLSALSPAGMMLGKLFGATAYVWFGAALCLLVLAYCVSTKLGLAGAVLWCGRLALLALFAQAVALAASLAAVRRGRAQARIDGFLFPLLGAGAFFYARGLLLGDDSVSRVFAGPDDYRWAGLRPENIEFFDRPWPASQFEFALLAVVLVWALTTAWRLMRVELQAPANPIWFAGFVLTPAVIAGGMASTPINQAVTIYAVLHLVALGTFFAEPKDVVSWRAFARDVQTGRSIGRRWPAAVTALILAFVGACLVCAVSIANPQPGSPDAPALLGFAAFAFLVREAAILAFFHLGAGQRRGDFAAVVTIGLLIYAGPTLMEVLGVKDAGAAFFINPEGNAVSHTLSICAGLVQAAIFGLAAQSRWRSRQQAVGAGAV
jgi:hypothetical protein